MQNLYEKDVTNTGNKVPLCMVIEKLRGVVKSSAPHLSDEETEKALKELFNPSFANLEFPRVMRQRVDPPLAQQNYHVFAFTPSIGAQPDKDGCYGALRVRGTFSSVQDAEEWSENIVRNHDSFHENMVGFVGRDFPLTSDSKYCTKTKEVDIRMKLDNVSRDNIKQQREEEKREMEEIQERQKQLLSDTTEAKEMCYDDIEYYTSLRVKRANVRILKEECEKKLKDCEKITLKTNQELCDLDERFPEYKKQYEEKYMNALDAIGGQTENNKMIEYMK
jgi:hypothetical protein